MNISSELNFLMIASINTHNLIISAYEYMIMFDKRSKTTCKLGEEQKEKLPPNSFSKCKAKCDEDSNCRFMRYSPVDNWCYKFAKCNEHQDDIEGITYYKKGILKLIFEYSKPLIDP